MFKKIALRRGKQVAVSAAVVVLLAAVAAWTQAKPIEHCVPLPHLSKQAAAACAGPAVVETWDCGMDPGPGEDTVFLSNCSAGPNGQRCKDRMKMYGSVTASLYDDGTFVISGSGEMYDFQVKRGCAWSFALAPWENSEHISTVTSIIIENGVTSIGSDAFNNFVNLKSVTIPNSVKSIGMMAFYNCKNLKSVNIPNGVTTVDYETFANCSSLESVTIPGSVTTIGYDAFANNSALASVTIPAGVTTIGRGTFAGCENLTSVTSLSVEPPAVDIYYSSRFDEDPIVERGAIFTGLPSGACLHVPNGSVAAYSNRLGWADVFSCINGEPLVPQMAWESGGATVALNGGTLTIGGSGGMADYPVTGGESNLAKSLCVYQKPTPKVETPWWTLGGAVTSVVIEAGVTSVGLNAFDNINGVKSLYSLNPIPPAVEIVTLAPLPGDVCLYVPEANIAAYRAAEGWSGFDCIQAAPEEMVSVKPTSRANAASRNPSAFVSVRGKTLTVRPSSPDAVSRVRLIDIRGKSVASFTARGNANFTLAKVPAGRYFAVVRGSGVKQTLSVVVK